MIVVFFLISNVSVDFKGITKFKKWLQKYLLLTKVLFRTSVL